MSQPTEVKITVKSEDTTLSENFLSYDDITISHDCLSLSQMVADTLSKFKGELKDPDVVVKIKYTW